MTRNVYRLNGYIQRSSQEKMPLLLNDLFFILKFILSLQLRNVIEEKTTS